jgi:hypothetical protein
MSEANRLAEEVARACDLNASTTSIDPVMIADRVMTAIGAVFEANPLEWIGCNLHVRQLARAHLRGRFASEPKQTDAEDDLFPETLQDRYPCRPHPDQEPVYTLRFALTEDDRWYNIERLRKTAVALVKHSNALEAETVSLFGARKAAAA